MGRREKGGGKGRSEKGKRGGRRQSAEGRNEKEGGRREEEKEGGGIRGKGKESRSPAFSADCMLRSFVRGLTFTRVC